MEAEPKYQDMAPGLTQTIEAGDEITLRDREGGEFSFLAKVDDKTLAFVQSFDEWLFVKNQGGAGVVLDALWDQLLRRYDDLPGHVRTHLTSYKNKALSVPVSPHTHA